MVPFSAVRSAVLGVARGRSARRYLVLGGEVVSNAPKRTRGRRVVSGPVEMASSAGVPQSSLPSVSLKRRG